MTHENILMPDAALHLQALLPELESIVQRRAAAIVKAKKEGKEATAQENDLNTLYQVLIAADSLIEAYNEIIIRLQLAYNHEVQFARREMEMLQLCYRSAAGNEALYADLLLKQFEKQRTLQ